MRALKPLSLVPTLGLFGIQVLAQDAVLGPPSTDPICSNPPLDQCAFYTNCLESRYQCGPNGYPLGYGHRFCQKFSDQRNLLDDRGRQWMLDTMHCLQLALVEDAVDAVPPAGDCETLKKAAFASHAGCYSGNGFCGLGVADWKAVLEIVDVTTLFESWDAFEATVETAGECVKFYAYVVEKGLFPESKGPASSSQLCSRLIGPHSLFSCSAR